MGSERVKSRRSLGEVVGGIRRRMLRAVEPLISRWFFELLIERTNNFAETQWLGVRIWQNTLDLWVIQEAIYEIKPAVVIECGTNRGGSALFYANLLDLIGSGRVISIDIEKMHDIAHPRITFVIGDSPSEAVTQEVRRLIARETGPIMVILDSDHSEAHVTRELNAYADFVTPGSLLLVQDGVIDVLPLFREGRPGPLPAIENFLRSRRDFTPAEEMNRRFIVTHHPLGWLRRSAAPG